MSNLLNTFAMASLGAGWLLSAASMAYSETLTHDEAHETLSSFYNTYVGRCVDLKAHPADGLYEPLDKRVDKVCRGEQNDVFNVFTMSCFKVQKSGYYFNHNIDLIERLKLENIIDRIGDVKGYVYFSMEGETQNRYRVKKSKNGALCGPFPNIKYEIDVETFHALTDKRYRVTFTSKNKTDDRTFRRFLIKEGKKSTHDLLYKDGKWRVVTE